MCLWLPLRLLRGRLAGCLLVRSSHRQPDFFNVCFSEDRSNPAYRYTASPRVQKSENIRHLPGARLDVRFKLSEWGSLGSYKVLWFRSCCLSFGVCFPPTCLFFVLLRLFARFGLRSEELHSQAAAGCCCCLLAAPCWSLGVLRWCRCPLLVFLLLLFDLLDDFPDLPLCSLQI